MNTDFIKGVVVPIVTPIDSEERIDEARLRAQIDYIIGGGLHGAETADHLGQYGYDVTIIEMRDGIATEDPVAVRNMLLERLEANHVKMLTSSPVRYVYSDGVDYEKDGEMVSLRGFGRVILALGSRSYNPLEEEMKDFDGELYVVGDAEKASNSVDAIYNGAVLGTKL